MIFNLSKTIFKKNLLLPLHFNLQNMLLTIDIGNTRIKYAVFEHNTNLENNFFLKSTLVSSVEKLLNKYTTITDCIISSVGNIEKEAFLTFETKINIHFVTNQFDFPFINTYTTPLTLGIDRMVLSAGAIYQFPTQNRLVIDAGTCVTYDFIDAENKYLGGAISPGIRLRYESLHNYTAKLPLLQKENPEALIGNSTSQSIHSGVINGLAFEIDGFIEHYKLQYSNFIIILTGGDALFLSKRLKNTIFANSNFLLESLNQLFQYKIQND
jgi:type III pantothenate kinase